MQSPMSSNIQLNKVVLTCVIVTHQFNAFDDDNEDEDDDCVER